MCKRVNRIISTLLVIAMLLSLGMPVYGQETSLLADTVTVQYMDTDGTTLLTNRPNLIAGSYFEEMDYNGTLKKWQKLLGWYTEYGVKMTSADTVDEDLTVIARLGNADSFTTSYFKIEPDPGATITYE